jgi:hypothetical protein
MYGTAPLGVSAGRTVGVGQSTVQMLNPGARPAHADRRRFESPGLAVAPASPGSGLPDVLGWERPA